MSSVKFLASCLFYGAYTSVIFCLMLPFILLKLLPIASLRTFCTRVLNALALSWTLGGQWWLETINPVQWHLQLPDGLSPNNWYLLVCNHQSWVDILVLQKTFNRKIPFIKFFIKRELIYIPLLGLAWWALDYPFMRRSGGNSVKQAKQDLIAASKACEKFRRLPTSVISFVEGTRFTAEKHRAQQSPYTHLLQPKAGGLSIALETMGNMFASVLDITIDYPNKVPTFLDVMTGRLDAVTVIVRSMPVPAHLLAQPNGRPASRAQVQAWLNALWQEKDQTLAAARVAPGQGTSPQADSGQSA